MLGCCRPRLLEVTEKRNGASGLRDDDDDDDDDDSPVHVTLYRYALAYTRASDHMSSKYRFLFHCKIFPQMLPFFFYPVKKPSHFKLNKKAMLSQR